MSRNWQPRYSCRCTSCDWKGQRTLSMMHNPCPACGAYPVNGLLLAASRRGLKPNLLGLCNSGDTAGDRSRVVGYAAFAFAEGADHG